MADDKFTKDGSVDFRNHPADRNKTGAWKACPFILGNECCERLAYYGMSSNLVIYFTKHLNQHKVTASKNLSNWSGTCYVTPLLGAFLADAYLGRYWTIASFSIIYVIGMILLTLSASVPGMKPICRVNNDCLATSGQTAIFYVALYLVALGTGGIKPCVSSYGADQFDDTDEGEKRLKASFFNWFYFSINVGALMASSALVYIQVTVGWGWGFGVPAGAMALAVGFFFSGTQLYRNQKPGGSPVTRICQVVVASLRKCRVEVPEDKSLLYETAGTQSSIIVGSRKLDHTDQFRFLDKAAVETPSDHGKGGRADRWRLCTVTQVEELKAVVRLLPVWATGIVFSAVYSQMGNVFVLQAEYMDTRLGRTSFNIPEASLGIFDILSVIFWVPVYDRHIIPLARRLTGHPTGLSQLQRMGTGLLISVLSMLSAAGLEIFRLDAAKRGNRVSVFWQAPQYFIIGCAEVFTFVGQLEFFYEQAPDSMRSLCTALSLTTAGLGNYLSSLLVTIVTELSTRGGRAGWIPDDLNRGRLHYFFLLLAGLSVVNLAAFLVVAGRYSYKRAVGTVR